MIHTLILLLKYLFQLVTLIFIELFIKSSKTACRVELRDNCAYKSNWLQLDSIIDSFVYLRFNVHVSSSLSVISGRYYTVDS